MTGHDRASSTRTGALTSLLRSAGPQSAPVPPSAQAPTGPAKRQGIRGLLADLGNPKTTARLVWIVGVVSFLSAASPAFHDRVGVVTAIVPPVFPAAATTGTLAAGVVLMLLANGLRRGKFRAWLLATILTGFATVAHLVKGLDIEEASLTAAVFVLGIPVATLLGFLWISVDLDGLAPSTTVLAKLQEAFLGLVGIPGPVSFMEHGAATRTSIGLAVLGAALVLLIVLVALQPVAGPHRLDDEERDHVHGLLRRWGGVDSLSWFALREDRAVIFSPSGKAAVSYRMVGGVSLAAGDPLGDPEAWPGAIAAWLWEASTHGWLPAVLGASE